MRGSPMPSENDAPPPECADPGPHNLDDDTRASECDTETSVIDSDITVSTDSPPTDPIMVGATSFPAQGQPYTDAWPTVHRSSRLGQPMKYTLEST